MFRRFESLSDPFAPEPGGPRTPPATLFAYLRWALAPMRRVIVLACLAGLMVALAETALIYYAGRVVDLMAAAAETVGAAALWSAHGLELGLVALAIMLLRPAAVAVQAGLINQALSINLVTLARWRAHRHVLGQSVGAFQSDFAGRIAARVMQTGQATEDAVYGAVEAILYCSAYIAGAALVLAGADARLLIPLGLWLLVYGGLIAVIVPRMGQAAEKT